MSKPILESYNPVVVSPDLMEIMQGLSTNDIPVKPGHVLLESVHTQITGAPVSSPFEEDSFPTQIRIGEI